MDTSVFRKSYEKDTNLWPIYIGIVFWIKPNTDFYYLSSVIIKSLNGYRFKELENQAKEILKKRSYTCEVVNLNMDSSVTEYRYTVATINNLISSCEEIGFECSPGIKENSLYFQKGGIQNEKDLFNYLRCFDPPKPTLIKRIKDLLSI